MKESKIRRTMKKRHKGRALKSTNGLVGNDAFVRETQMYTTVKPLLFDFGKVERVLYSSLCCSTFVKSVNTYFRFRGNFLCSTLLKLFTFGIGNFLSNFGKVVLILILWLSSLPRDVITERAFPVFNENQSITLTLTA